MRTEKAVILLFYFVVIVIVLLVAASCNPVKRVLKDPAKVEIVGREWEKSNPCINDTIVQTESDTVTVTETVEVPGYSVVINDTVYKILPGRVQTKTVTIRDTVIKNVTDNRRLNIALDSVNYYKGLSIQRQAQIDEVTGQRDQERKRGNKWVLYFWILVAVAAGSHYLRSKLKLFGL